MLDTEGKHGEEVLNKLGTPINVYYDKHTHKTKDRVTRTSLKAMYSVILGIDQDQIYNNIVQQTL
jgi:hypothetical protein